MNANISTYGKGIVAYFGASAVPMLCSLIANRWIALNMSPQEYAIAGYYGSFTALLQPIIAFYMVHFFIKEYFRVDAAGRTRLFAAVGKSLIWFSALVSVVCFGVMNLYLYHSTPEIPISPYLALMVFSLPLSGLLNLVLARYRMEHRPTAYFWLSTCNGVLLVALNILWVVVLKQGAVGKLLAPLLGNVVVMIYLVVAHRDELSEHITMAEYVAIFKFCMPLALGAMLGYFTNGFDRTYLESIGDSYTYGHYIVGASIVGYLSVFSMAVYHTFQPGMYSAINSRDKRLYMRLLLAQQLVIVAFVVVFIVLCPHLISLLTAGRYVCATPFARVMSLSVVTSSIYFVINDFSIATHRPNLYLITSAIGSVLIIMLMPMVVSRGGYFGGAWMCVFSYIICAIVNIILLFGVRKKRLSR